jgi:D-alanyl-D-alanine carboxypeptidase/D-alanyl-D-alanine-endopeptidase (penicillin-binding protein 4)
MKVLTALAALATFGPTHQFTTTVSADRPLDGEGAVGTLAVRGGGDPALTSEVLWRLAADLQRRGLRRVRDGLLLDDAYFDNERWNPAWGSPSVRAYHAPVAALTANYGAFSVEVAPPARAGLPAAVSVDPPVPFFRLTSGVRVGGDAPISVDRDSDGDSERIRVGGSVRPGAATVAVQRSVTDPVRYAGAVLRMQLAALGIAVDGPDRVGPVPAGFHELVAFRGKPLGDVVALLMKWSNNNIAEMLVKNLGAHASGAPGSWPTGVAAVQAQLGALGVDQSGLAMFDGSGLAAADRVTPRTLVGALRAARASFAFGPRVRRRAADRRPRRHAEETRRRRHGSRPRQDRAHQRRRLAVRLRPRQRRPRADLLDPQQRLPRRRRRRHRRQRRLRRSAGAVARSPSTSSTSRETALRAVLDSVGARSPARTAAEHGARTFLLRDLARRRAATCSAVGPWPGRLSPRRVLTRSAGLHARTGRRSRPGRSR